MFSLFCKCRWSGMKLLLQALCKPKSRSKPRRPPPENKTTGINTCIPDDILVNILLRLPSESVLICRCVCRSWKDLTSTPEFVKLHASSSAPVVTWVEGAKDGKGKVTLLDSWEGGATTRRSNRRIRTHRVIINPLSTVSESEYPQFFGGCIHGLHILREEFPSSVELYHLVVVNPLTNEQVRLIGPRGNIIGVYLNPFTKDQYWLLWLGKKPRPNGSLDYRLIFLGDGGSNSETRNRIRELSDDDALVAYAPLSFIPRMVDDVLYWMVGRRRTTSRGPCPGGTLTHSCAESIMTFNTRSEKFSAMPHPGPHGEWCREDVEHTRMHLAEVNGSALCLCECSLLEPVIHMWILKQGGANSSSNHSWEKWKTLNIHLLFSRRNPDHPSTAKGYVKLMAIVNGRAYITFPPEDGRGLFAFNLNSNTAQNVRKGGRLPADAFTYRPCLLPIGVSKPEIWMPSEPSSAVAMANFSR